MFTQPLMYKRIRGHKSAHQRYVEALLARGDADAATVRAVHDNVQAKLNEAFEAAKDYEPKVVGGGVMVVGGWGGGGGQGLRGDDWGVGWGGGGERLGGGCVVMRVMGAVRG